MPIVDGKMLTPDEAMAAGRCPECGVDLTKVNPIAELKSHWQTEPKDNRQGAEGLRRMLMLKQYINDHSAGTSNKPAGPIKPAPIAQ